MRRRARKKLAKKSGLPPHVANMSYWRPCFEWLRTKGQLEKLKDK